MIHTKSNFHNYNTNYSHHIPYNDHFHHNQNNQIVPKMLHRLHILYNLKEN